MHQLLATLGLSAWNTSYRSHTDYCTPNYAIDMVPKGFKQIHTTILFKHGLHAPIDKIPGKDPVWNCSGNTWLYPGGDAHNDDLTFLHQFKIQPIPSQSFLKGTCKAGEILMSGVEQMKELAQVLKTSYLQHTTFTTPKRHISLRSTYTNRCLASIQTILHYLYPGSNPVDVFVANEELETLVPNAYVCPTLTEIFQKVISKSEPFSKALSIFENVTTKIQKDQNILALPDWLRLGELLSTQHCAGVGLPQGFDEYTLDMAAEVLLTFFSEVMKDPEGKKYASGLLLTDIYHGMRDYLAGNTDSQFVLIAGHTLSFLSVFSALGIDYEWPAYGSYISFSIIEKEELRVVRINYNGRNMMSIEFSAFEEMVKINRPTESECKVIYPYPERNKKDLGQSILQKSFS